MTSMSLGSRFDDGVAIPVTTLDAETRELSGPFLMKIDVEGYERAGLRRRGRISN